MADKDTVALIKKHDQERPGLFLGKTLEAGGRLSEAVLLLVEDYREVARLYAGAQMRGGKALQQECNTTANKLALLARGLEQAESVALRRVTEIERTPAASAGLDEAVHGFHAVAGTATCNVVVTRDNKEQVCGRYASHPAHRMQANPAAAPGALEALVADSANPRSEPGAALAEVIEQHASQENPMFELTDPASVPEPPYIEYEQNGFVQREYAPMLTDPPAQQRAGDRCPDCGETADVPSVCGDAWHGRPVYAAPQFEEPWSVPGTRVTWDDLTAAMGDAENGAGLPEHLSHSQKETLGECGTKYLLQRSETLGVVQVPQWALIGGDAFHACVEWFEKLVAEVKQAQYVGHRLAGAGGIGEIWRKQFGETITETAIANPLVPQEHWRAARKGAEGYTWWLVEGESMLVKYVTMRMVELGNAAIGWRTIRWDTQGDHETAMIEHEAVMDVNGVPFKLIIDQVWDVRADEGPMRAGDLLIDDLKSGRGIPVETGQLEEYALWLVRQLPESMLTNGNPPAVWGRFYDARHGTYTEPVDLLERADWRRFSFEVAAADRRKRAGIFDPRPSSFCGGCSVKHACPVFALAGA
jgi:hypothetical protein